MDYGKDILNRLIDMYERRGAFDKDASSLRAIQIEVKKVYPVYVDTNIMGGRKIVYVNGTEENADENESDDDTTWYG